ncbi:hypothetical protein [Frigidibacter oleivorans]|uniref:hypothetical protein n=1 Tax=Frigidibacter oleivorans TaxID=2487129 RepID=UPI000F8F272A|nr:hypothetical protein [Frigidibacter oleivorans]
MKAFLSLKTQYANLGDEAINSLLISEICRRCRTVAWAGGAPDWYVANIRENLGPLSERLEVVSSSRDFFKALTLNSLSGQESVQFLSCGAVSSTKSHYAKVLPLAATLQLPRMTLA